MTSFANSEIATTTAAMESVTLAAASSTISTTEAVIDDIINEAMTEDKTTALQQWWIRHGDNFTTWFTSISGEQRAAFIKDVAPDIPKELPGIRASKGETLLPTDILLPELTIDGLLGGDGKLLCLLMSRRLLPLDRCFLSDIMLLNGLMERKALPSFSQGHLVGMDTPFVDPSDPEENVRSIGPTTSASSRAEISKYLAKGRLVHAEVWLALRVRRDAVVSFLVGLVQEFEDAMYCPNKRKEYLAAALASTAAVTATSNTETSISPAVPLVAATESSSIADVVSTSSSSSPPVVRPIEFFEVSPTYEALLRGELQQQRVLDDMLAKKQAEEDQATSSATQNQGTDTANSTGTTNAITSAAITSNS